MPSIRLRMHLLLGAQLQQGLSMFRGFRYAVEPSECRWSLVPLRFDDVAEAGVAPGRPVLSFLGFAIRAAAAALWRLAVGVGVPVWVWFIIIEYVL